MTAENTTYRLLRAASEHPGLGESVAAVEWLQAIGKTLMLNRACQEITRSLARSQENGDYDPEEVDDRYLRLVKSARRKVLGYSPRGRLPYDVHLAVEALSTGFENLYPPPPKKSVGLPRFFTTKEKAEIRELVTRVKLYRAQEIEDDETLGLAPYDHLPDFDGTGESAFFIGIAQNADHWDHVHEVDGIPDPCAGYSDLERLEYEFMPTLPHDIITEDTRSHLTYGDRGNLRHLDMQTYEDYLLDHAEEIAEEEAMNAAQTINEWPPAASTIEARVDVMWIEYLQSVPPLQRLKLLKRMYERDED